jgi:hypothetical protein
LSSSLISRSTATLFAGALHLILNSEGSCDFDARVVYAVDVLKPAALDPPKA